MIVEPYVIHGEVSEANLSTFESQCNVNITAPKPSPTKKKHIKSKTCSDWLNW